MNTTRATNYTGTHVFRIMDSKGQKRSWLAAELGCHPTTISKIELGQRRIPRWFVDGCVRLFALPEEALFFESNGLRSPISERSSPVEVPA